MNCYNPDHTPNPKQWLALDEQIRIQLVEGHHRAKRIKQPNLTAHAASHTMVENQVAENTESVVRAMARLAAQGLSRHEALHAIGSVLVEQIHTFLKVNADENDFASSYNAAVERLAAKGWRGG